jgi:hypothetical protein
MCVFCGLGVGESSKRFREVLTWPANTWVQALWTASQLEGLPTKLSLGYYMFDLTLQNKDDVRAFLIYIDICSNFNELPGLCFMSWQFKSSYFSTGLMWTNALLICCHWAEDDELVTNMLETLVNLAPVLDLRIFSSSKPSFIKMTWDITLKLYYPVYYCFYVEVIHLLFFSPRQWKGCSSCHNGYAFIFS